MPAPSKLLRWPPPILLVVSLFAVYRFSLAPDFTWAHDGADGGDLIAAAATGGVPHPSGYPTFILLARLFQLLPLGSLAYRTNLMSAVFTALTAFFVYDLVVASPDSPARGNRLAGIVAGLAYGLSPLAWSQAVITEVYGLHIFFVALVLWLLAGRFADSPDKRWLDAGIGLALGLALGDHLTAAILLPAVLLAGIPVRQTAYVKGRKSESTAVDWASLGRRLGGIAAGLLVYLAIPVRAGSGAPVDWGHAVDLPGLWWLVSGAFYQHYAFSLPAEYLPLRIASVAQLLYTQFWILGLLAGLFHLIWKFGASRLALIGVWVAAASLVFSLGYDTIDSYIYLLPFFLVFAIWIGCGLGKLAGLLDGKPKWIGLAAGGLLLLSLGVMAVLNFPKLDLSKDQRAAQFEKTVFAALPPQAIVVAKGDEALFAMWYAHFVRKDRPDIAVLADGLLNQAWYFDVLHATYPTLKISLQAVSSGSVEQANPARPLCDVEIAGGQLTLDCYRAGAPTSDTPYISIAQPIE